jgi:glycolate oxidase
MKKMNADWLATFRKLLGEKGVVAEEGALQAYAHDETEDLHFYPEVALKPKTTEEVAAILRFCNEHKIPVTPRGAGTGLSGGALPVNGGVALSLERMNTIVSIDEENLQATVEPGVITQVFQEAVAEKGLFYPPDPSSRGSCFIGGNLAENAGGPKAVKYGVTKDYVLNLEVVLPNGEIIWTGANVLKNATGYNLTQLMVGSEGTLGVITKAVFRLLPAPTYDLLLLVPFYSAEEACAAVARIFKAGVTPSGLEFMERDALVFGMQHVEGVQVALEDGVEAHLLIELDGNDLDVLYKECEVVNEVVQQFKCGEPLFADTAAQKEQLWKLRRSLGEAVKRHSVYKEEDTVVPRAALPLLLKAVKEIGKKYGFESVCYGHAGDGNLHVNILKGNMSDAAWENDLPKGIAALFEQCVALGGTISGEHGIGWVQKRYLPIVFNKTELALQRSIKDVFDPNGIMNPSKVFP